MTTKTRFSYSYNRKVKRVSPSYLILQFVHQNKNKKNVGFEKRSRSTYIELWNFETKLLVTTTLIQRWTWNKRINTLFELWFDVMVEYSCVMDAPPSWDLFFQSVPFIYQVQGQTQKNTYCVVARLPHRNKSKSKL